jgi:hypothetical protein
MYQKTLIPPNYEEDWLDRELQAIEQALTMQDFLWLVETNVEPERPREGMIYFADGSDWDPGGGRGIYAYYSGAWNKL